MIILCANETKFAHTLHIMQGVENAFSSVMENAMNGKACIVRSVISALVATKCKEKTSCWGEKNGWRGEKQKKTVGEN